ncbi:type II toxin-antitoxin system HicA family toxin [Candidatus Falkowbacteria bacterium]|nr:type II toxin-antitoxin system HicA family toxin [Candidatus Falkowbacteria bacterium]
MPKLPVLTPKKLLLILQRKGFLTDHTTGSHIILRHPVSLKRVVIPFHTKDLPKGTIISILKQSGLTKKDLI